MVWKEGVVFSLLLVESEETTLTLFAQNLIGIEVIVMSVDSVRSNWLVFSSPIVNSFSLVWRAGLFF